MIDCLLHFTYPPQILNYATHPFTLASPVLSYPLYLPTHSILSEKKRKKREPDGITEHSCRKFPIFIVLHLIKYPSTNIVFYRE